MKSGIIGCFSAEASISGSSENWGYIVNIPEMLMTAFGLSADALAAAVCGAADTGKERRLRVIFIQAAVFGLFQFLMPVAGWLAGSRAGKLFSAADHWIAFGLLTFIGAKAFIGAVYGSDEETAHSEFKIGLLMMSAVATSIDALAAGAGLAFIDADIALFAALAGGVTFAVCAAGGALGKGLGEKFGRASSAAGGIILMITGTRILLSHLSGS